MSSVDSSSSLPTSSAEKLSDKNNNNNNHHQHNNDILEQYGVHLDGDDDNQRICWNSDAPDHPRNWSPSMKTYTTTIICWLELYMTGISSAGVSERERQLLSSSSPFPTKRKEKENHIQLTIDEKINRQAQQTPHVSNTTSAAHSPTSPLSPSISWAKPLAESSWLPCQKPLAVAPSTSSAVSSSASSPSSQQPYPPSPAYTLEDFSKA